MASEDECVRDEKGLSTRPHRGLKTEAEARSAYWMLYAKLLFIQAPAVAWPLYFAAKRVAPVEDKLAFAHEHGLGWVFLAWWVVYVMRILLSINANAVRAAAKVDRPDQHVYRLMSAKCDAEPYVMMVNTGDLGRWNRAQRACYNTDESLPVFLSGLVLVAIVYGPVAFGLAALNAYGRVTFARLYTESQASREVGFLPAVISEHLSAALLMVAAINSFATAPF